MSSRDWIPKGSVPYDTAYADDLLETTDGSVAYFSTVPYRGAPKPRDPKLCVGNEGTCKGFKAGGTSFCNGHLKSQAKQAAEAAAAVA